MDGARSLDVLADHRMNYDGSNAENTSHNKNDLAKRDQLSKRMKSNSSPASSGPSLQGTREGLLCCQAASVILGGKGVLHARTLQALCLSEKEASATVSSDRALDYYLQTAPRAQTQSVRLVRDRPCQTAEDVLETLYRFTGTRYQKLLPVVVLFSGLSHAALVYLPSDHPKTRKAIVFEPQTMATAKHSVTRFSSVRALTAHLAQRLAQDVSEDAAPLATAFILKKRSSTATSASEPALMRVTEKIESASLSTERARLRAEEEAEEQGGVKAERDEVGKKDMRDANEALLSRKAREQRIAARLRRAQTASTKSLFVDVNKDAHFSGMPLKNEAYEDQDEESLERQQNVREVGNVHRVQRKEDEHQIEVGYQRQMDEHEEDRHHDHDYEAEGKMARKSERHVQEQKELEFEQQREVEAEEQDEQDEQEQEQERQLEDDREREHERRMQEQRELELQRQREVEEEQERERERQRRLEEEEQERQRQRQLRLEEREREHERRMQEQRELELQRQREVEEEQERERERQRRLEEQEQERQRQRQLRLEEREREHERRMQEQRELELQRQREVEEEQERERERQRRFEEEEQERQRQFRLEEEREQEHERRMQEQRELELQRQREAEEEQERERERQRRFEEEEQERQRQLCLEEERQRKHEGRMQEQRGLELQRQREVEEEQECERDRRMQAQKELEIQQQQKEDEEGERKRRLAVEEKRNLEHERSMQEQRDVDLQRQREADKKDLRERQHRLKEEEEAEVAIGRRIQCQSEEEDAREPERIVQAQEDGDDDEEEALESQRRHSEEKYDLHRREALENAEKQKRLDEIATLARERKLKENADREHHEREVQRAWVRQIEQEKARNAEKPPEPNTMPAMFEDSPAKEPNDVNLRDFAMERIEELRKLREEADRKYRAALAYENSRSEDPKATISPVRDIRFGATEDGDQEEAAIETAKSGPGAFSAEHRCLEELSGDISPREEGPFKDSAAHHSLSPVSRQSPAPRSPGTPTGVSALSMELGRETVGNKTRFGSVARNVSPSPSSPTIEAEPDQTGRRGLTGNIASTSQSAPLLAVDSRTHEVDSRQKTKQYLHVQSARDTRLSPATMNDRVGSLSSRSAPQITSRERAEVLHRLRAAQAAILRERKVEERLATERRYRLAQSLQQEVDLGSPKSNVDKAAVRSPRSATLGSAAYQEVPEDMDGWSDFSEGSTSVIAPDSPRELSPISSTSSVLSDRHGGAFNQNDSGSRHSIAREELSATDEDRNRATEENLASPDLRDKSEEELDDEAAGQEERPRPPQEKLFSIEIPLNGDDAENFRRQRRFEEVRRRKLAESEARARRRTSANTPVAALPTSTLERPSSLDPQATFSHEIPLHNEQSAKSRGAKRDSLWQSQTGPNQSDDSSPWETQVPSATLGSSRSRASAGTFRPRPSQNPPAQVRSGHAPVVCEIPPEIPPTIEIATKSNLKLIMNAITHVCLAGAHHAQRRERVLGGLEERAASGEPEFTNAQYVILFRNEVALKFRGVYVVDRVTRDLRKVQGAKQLPAVVDATMVDSFYKYNTGQKRFSRISTKSITKTTDAVALNPKFFPLPQRM